MKSRLAVAIATVMLAVLGGTAVHAISAPLPDSMS
jgi:hypothetical protein